MRLTGRHFPSLMESSEGAKDKHPSKQCRVCDARGLRAPKGGKLKTCYVCASCPSEPGLHPGVCFQAFHTQLDFSI